MTVPVHSGKKLAPKTLQSILQAAGITLEEFEKRL
ncbi:type II toxin-antitoxin system HicA family toxin [Methanospirillum stamsii]|nr:type II toxin-antitoxin system HicA family toxin [Methanospirillum stamsii]